MAAGQFAPAAGSRLTRTTFTPADSTVTHTHTYTHTHTSPLATQTHISMRHQHGDTLMSQETLLSACPPPHFPLPPSFTRDFTLPGNLEAFCKVLLTVGFSVDCSYEFRRLSSPTRLQMVPGAAISFPFLLLHQSDLMVTLTYPRLLRNWSVQEEVTAITALTSQSTIGSVRVEGCLRNGVWFPRQLLVHYLSGVLFDIASVQPVLFLVCFPPDCQIILTPSWM